MTVLLNHENEKVKYMPVSVFRLYASLCYLHAPSMYSLLICVENNYTYNFMISLILLQATDLDHHPKRTLQDIPDILDHLLHH